MNEQELKIKEYEICLQEAARLEGNVWKTASIFAVGSAGTLVAVFGLETQLRACIVLGFLSVAIAFVWRGFALRWLSIQDLKFEHLNLLEHDLGFRQNGIVGEEDDSSDRPNFRRVGLRPGVYLLPAIYLVAWILLISLELIPASYGCLELVAIPVATAIGILMFVYYYEKYK